MAARSTIKRETGGHGVPPLQLHPTATLSSKDLVRAWFDLAKYLVQDPGKSDARYQQLIVYHDLVPLVIGVVKVPYLAVVPHKLVP